jgi:hypothetical protein
MINGAHVILYSRKADADREFFRDVLKLPSVDVGRGWLIFGLPPAEVAVHPAEGEAEHELYLMCADIDAFVKDVKARGIACAPVSEQPWGRLTTLTLPGGGPLGVYQPKHARPPAMKVPSLAKRTPRPPAKRLNAPWHAKHRMPKKATLQQRVRWHIAHAEACGCRPMPKSVQLALRSRKKLST